MNPFFPLPIIKILIMALILLQPTLTNYLYQDNNQADDITSITWSDDQSLLAIATNDGDIQIIHAETREIVTIILSNYGFVYKIEWESDNQRIATRHPGGIIAIWDTMSGNLLKEIQATNDLLNLEWSQTGNLYISSLEGGTYIWDMNTYEFIEKLSFAGYDFNFSPNGEYLAIGGLRGSSIYHLQTKSIIHIPSDDTVVYTLWNSNSTKLAMKNLSGEFIVWNLITNQVEINFQMESGHLMRWAENHLYVANINAINIWDTTTWQIISSIPLAPDSFISRQSDGLFYVEYNQNEIVQIVTYCEIIESGDISALSNAIADGNSIIFNKQICLAENGIYTLTTTLPTITGDITLIGNGARLIPLDNQPVFDVADGGNLTLNDVVISGGQGD